MIASAHIPYETVKKDPQCFMYTSAERQHSFPTCDKADGCPKAFELAKNALAEEKGHVDECADKIVMRYCIQRGCH